jgi:hypothetical protein
VRIPVTQCRPQAVGKRDRGGAPHCSSAASRRRFGNFVPQVRFFLRSVARDGSEAAVGGTSDSRERRAKGRAGYGRAVPLSAFKGFADCAICAGRRQIVIGLS